MINKETDMETSNWFNESVDRDAVVEILLCSGERMLARVMGWYTRESDDVKVVQLITYTGVDSYGEPVEHRSWVLEESAIAGIGRSCLTKMQQHAELIRHSKRKGAMWDEVG